ncbi:hypothetical protein CPC08DRAFT_768187 [Agrocybe pediades]|nr:hypothetical protein CPC08DRAFT_768187 [Agrocybe pediades]
MRLSTTITATSLLASGAFALTLQPLVNATIGGIAEVHWTIGPNDPATWNLFLMDPNYIFGLKGILATNVDNSLGHITVSLAGANVQPGVPYNLQAANANEPDLRYAASPVFTLSK